MFKQAAYAVAAAAAFAAMPAQAATVVFVTDDGVNGDGIIEFAPSGPNSVTGGFSFLVEEDDNGSGFTATYQFNNTFFNPADGAATLIFNVGAAGADLVFTGATLAGGAGSQSIVNGDPLSTVYVFNSPIPLGASTLTFSGNLVNGARSSTASGTLDLSAVPEPTTWALLILGFGAVGHTMRRRSSKVRLGKASLNFA